MDIERGHYTQVKEKANHPICTISLVLFLVLNVIMLCVGILERDACPIQRNVPLYLMVAGAIGIISKVLPFINRKLEWCLLDLMVSVSYLFEFIWVILGSVWVYSIYRPNFNPDMGDYCDETTYLLGFWLLTLHWIFLGLSIILVCCCCCCACLKSDN